MDHTSLLIVPKMTTKLRTSQRLNLGRESHRRMWVLFICFLVGVSSVSAISSSTEENPKVSSSQTSAVFGARESSLEQSDGGGDKDSEESPPPLESVRVTYVTTPGNDKDSPGVAVESSKEILSVVPLPTALGLSQASAEEAVAAVEAVEANGSVEGTQDNNDDNNEEPLKEEGRSGRRLNFNHFHPPPHHRNNGRPPPPPSPHRFHHHLRPQRESLRLRGPPRPRPSILVDNNEESGERRNPDLQTDAAQNAFSSYHQRPSGSSDLQTADQTLYDLRGFSALNRGNVNNFNHLQQHHLQTAPRLNNPFAAPLQLQQQQHHQDLRNSPLIFPSFFQPQSQSQEASQLPTHNNIFGHNQHHQQSVFELPSHLTVGQRGVDREKEPSEFRPSQIDPSLTNLPVIQAASPATASSTASSTTENSFSFTPVHQPFLQRQPSLQQQEQPDGEREEKQPESFIYVYEDIDYDNGGDGESKRRPQSSDNEDRHRGNKISQDLKVNNPSSGSNGLTQLRTNQPTAILIDTTTVPPLVSSIGVEGTGSRFQEPTRQNLIQVDNNNEEEEERRVLPQFPLGSQHQSFTTGPNVEIVPSSERKPPPDQSNAVLPSLTITQRPSGRFIGERDREREDFRLRRPPPPPPNGPFDIFPPTPQQQQQQSGPFGNPFGPNGPPSQRQPGRQRDRPPPPFLEPGSPNAYNGFPRQPPPPLPPPQRRPTLQFQLPTGPDSNSNENEDFFNNDPILNHKLNPFLRPTNRPDNNNNSPFNNNPRRPSNINFNPHNQLYDSQIPSSPFLIQQQQQPESGDGDNGKNIDDFAFQSQKFQEQEEVPVPTRSPPLRSTTTIPTTTTIRTTTTRALPPFNNDVEDDNTKSSRPSSSLPVRSRFPPFRGTTSAPSHITTTTTEGTTEVLRKRPNRPGRTRTGRPNKVPSTTPLPEVSQDIDYDYEAAKQINNNRITPTPASERPRIRTRPSFRATTTTATPLTVTQGHSGGRFQVDPSPSLPVRGDGGHRQVYERPTGRGPPPSRFEVEQQQQTFRDYDRFNSQNERPVHRDRGHRDPTSPPSAPPRSSGKPLYLSGKMLEKEGGLYAGLGHIANDHVYGSPIPLIPINQVFDRMPDIYSGKVVSPSGPPRHHQTHILPPFPPIIHNNSPPSAPSQFIRNHHQNRDDFSDISHQQQQLQDVGVSGKSKIKANPKNTRNKSQIHATTPESKSPQENFRQTVVEDKFVRKPNPKIRQHHTQTTEVVQAPPQQQEIYNTPIPATATGNGPRGRVVGGRKRRPSTTTETPQTSVQTTTEEVIVTVSEEISHNIQVTRPPQIVQAEETPPLLLAPEKEKFTPFRRRPNRPAFKKPKPTLPLSNAAEEPPIPPPRPQPPRKLRARPRFNRPQQKVPEPTDDNEQQGEEAKEIQEREIPMLTSILTTTTENPEVRSSVRIFRKPTEAPGRFSSRFREENPPFAVTRSPIQLTTKTRPSFKPAKTTKRVSTTTSNPSPKRKPASVPQAEDNIPPSIRLKAEDVIARRKPARRIPADSVSLRLQEKRKKLQGARRKVTPTDVDPDSDFTSAESRSDNESGQNKREITHHHTVLEPLNELLDEELKDEGNINNSTEDSEETAKILRIPKPTGQNPNVDNKESTTSSSKVPGAGEDSLSKAISKGKYDDSEEEELEIIAVNNDRRSIINTTPSPDPKLKLQLVMQRKRERGTTTTTVSPSKSSRGTTSSSIRDRDVARLRTSKRPKIRIPESQETAGSQSSAVYTSATLNGIQFLKSPPTTPSPFSIFTMATQEPSLPLVFSFNITTV